MDCEACRPLLPAYGDNELSVESALDVERHVRSCVRCRTVLDRQRVFSETVGHLYPRTPLPAGLEERVRRGLHRAPGSRFWLNGLALAASLLLVVGAVWVLSRPSAIAAPPTVIAAADVHRGARQHKLPLAIESADAVAVNTWLTHALPFPLSAPVQPTTAMTLEGAALVDLAGERVGYVRYRKGEHPISLFLLPPRAWPQTGQRIQAGNVEFHLYAIDGLKLIAWNHAPLSYVLVSDLGGQGAQACAVCHSSLVDAASIALPKDDTI